MNGMKKDQHGAVMVMVLFMGIFLVALLYHLLGMGQAMMENLHMQDAADSVAFSAVTAHARGMNTIALINLVMATAMAVLVAIRLLQMIIGVAIAAVTVLCVVSYGTGCGALPKLAHFEHKLKKMYEKAEDVVKPIIKAAAKAERVVNKATPFLAEAEAIYISRKEGDGVPILGLAVPIKKSLPTKDGTIDVLCEHAGRQVAEVAEFFLPPIIPAQAMVKVSDLLGNLAGDFSSFFCGGKGGKSPRPDSHQEVAYPLQSDSDCEDPTARPSRSKQECTTDLCRRCAQEACAGCIEKGSGRYKKSQWRKETVRWDERTDDKTGRKTIVTQYPLIAELESRYDDPCYGKGACGDLICESTTYTPLPGGINFTMNRVERITYRQIFSCTIVEEVEVDAPDQPMDNSETEVPLVLDNDAEPDDFRMRSFVLGNADGAARSGDVGKLHDLSAKYLPGKRLSFAAGEYYSGAHDLWHLDWSGRLIRFRSETGDLDGGEMGEFADKWTKLKDRVKSVSDYGQDFILH